MKKSDDSYISSEERMEKLKQMFNTDDETKASKIPDLILKTDKTSRIVDDRSWGDGNPCYAVYYVSNKNIHVKLEGICDRHSSPQEQQWHRSFICKEIVKEYTEWEEVKIEKPKLICSHKTKEQIVEMVANGYQADLDLLGSEYDWGQAFTINRSYPDHEFVKLVEEGREPAGGEGEYNIFRLYHIPSYDLYIKVLGYYSSYDSTSWNSMCFVRKIIKQRTVYV